MLSGLVEPIPWPVLLTEETAGVYSNSGLDYDFSVAGIPLVSAADDQSPFIRETAEYRKEQFDNNGDVGEQSFVYWWLWSQSSFHGGSGVVYAESVQGQQIYQPDPTPFRFADSAGVDVFTTTGSVSLLKGTTAGIACGSELCPANDGTHDGLVFWRNDTNKIMFMQSDGTLTTLNNNTAVTGVLSVCSDGQNYYYATAAGIWSGPVGTAATAAVKQYAFTATRVKLGWCKRRLMAGINNSIYQLQSAPGSPPVSLPSGVSPVFSQPVYSDQDTSYTFNSFADGPEAIYVSGYSSSQSSIFRFVLSSTGDVPVLSSAESTDVLPPYERVTCIFSYLNSFLGIGTTKGFRVATFSAGGAIQAGPLLFTLPSGSTGVQGITGSDGFFYVAAPNMITDASDGVARSGLIRVNLGQLVDTGRYAWATDLQAHVTGAVSAVSLLSAGPVMVANGTVYTQATTYEPTGFLLTGRVRYHTLDDKLFKFLRLRADPLHGSLAATIIDRSGGSLPLVEYSTAGSAPLDETRISQPPTEYSSLRFDFAAGDTNTSTPVFHGYQVKGLPAQKRQRKFTVPVFCFDYYRDRYGNRAGQVGYALRVIEQLEAVEEAADVVLFQFLAPDRESAYSRNVVIDQVQFVQMDPPGEFEGFGGKLTLVLRSVD